MLSPVTGESVSPRIGFLPGTSGVVAAAAAGFAGALVTAGFAVPAVAAGAADAVGGAAPGAAGSVAGAVPAGEAGAGGDAPAGVADASLRLSCPSSIRMRFSIASSFLSSSSFEACAGCGFSALSSAARAGHALIKISDVAARHMLSELALELRALRIDMTVPIPCGPRPRVIASVIGEVGW